MVPQSHAFYIGTSGYTADLYFERNGRRFVVEVKSEEGFNDFEEKSQCLREYLKSTVFEFIHISNESIAEHEIYALNWLLIARTLVTSELVVTEQAEDAVLDRLYGSSLALGDLIDMQDRIGSANIEVALFRLANIGKVMLDLEHERLNANTTVALCQP